MKRLCLWLFIFLLFVSSVAFPFAIEPARLELIIPAGGRRGQTILIDNTKESSPLHVRVYSQDITYLPDGTHDFLPPGSTEWSCSQWIKVVPNELDIPAGKTKSVRVSVEVPAGMKGGRYAALFFEGGAVQSLMQGIAVNLRIGVTVLVTIRNTEILKARLTNISFTKPKDIEVSIFNDGNVMIRPEGRIKILNSKGKRIKSLEFNPNKLGILPQSLRKFNTQLDETLPKEKYTLKAEIDFGQEYLLVGELPIDLE